MTGGDRYKPLWAGWPADEPRPDDDGVIVRVLQEPEEVPPPPGDPKPSRRPMLILGVMAAVFVGALLTAVAGRGALTIEDVPSYWEDVPMTCHTVRIEQDERAVESFSCRAVGGRALPPGLYRSPDSRWTSDITRRDARENRIQISPDGEVVGWATY